MAANKELIEILFQSLISGRDEADILVEMGLTEDQYNKIKENLFEAKAEEIRNKPLEHVYVQYVLDQMRNIHELNDIISEARTAKNAAGATRAIKTRSDILEKIIAQGQDMGIIHKEANKTQIVGGIVVAELTHSELKKQIAKELISMNLLMEKYGDGNIIDVTPGALHYGEASSDAILEDAGVKSPEESDVTRTKSVKQLPPKKELTKFTKANNSKRVAGRVKTRIKKIKVM